MSNNSNSRTNDKSKELFENAPVSKAVFVNIIPSVVGMIMSMIYNLADAFFYWFNSRSSYVRGSITWNSSVHYFYGSWTTVWYWRNLADI